MGWVFDHWPAAGTDVSDKATARATAAIAELKHQFLIAELPSRGRRAAILPVLPTRRAGAFSKRKALVLEDLRILFLMTIEEHAHLPGFREHLRVFDGGFAVDLFWADRRVTLDHVQGVAVEVPGPVEPGFVVELEHVDDQRIPLPAAT